MLAFLFVFFGSVIKTYQALLLKNCARLSRTVVKSLGIRLGIRLFSTFCRYLYSRQWQVRFCAVGFLFDGAVLTRRHVKLCSSVIFAVAEAAAAAAAVAAPGGGGL